MIFELKKDDLMRVVDTDSGINMLKYFFQECGYDQPSVTVNPYSKDINHQSTVYNEARRNVWLEFRKMVPNDKLALIELNQVLDIPTNEVLKEVLAVKDEDKEDYASRRDERHSGFRKIQRQYAEYGERVGSPVQDGPGQSEGV